MMFHGNRRLKRERSRLTALGPSSLSHSFSRRKPLASVPKEYAFPLWRVLRCLHKDKLGQTCPAEPVRPGLMYSSHDPCVTVTMFLGLSEP